MITTGEGGALFVNTEKQLERATKLRSHGIEKQTTKSEKKEFEWYYEQTELGYNFRMSEIQAALGTSQMDRLEYFVRKRNYLASLYKDRLSKVPLKLQTVDPNSLSSYHLFTVEITDPRFSRNLLYKYLINNKIGCQVHYIPVHLQPFYKNKGFSAGQFENAELYYKNCLSIPLHQGLNEDDIEIVCEKLFSFFNGDR